MIEEYQSVRKAVNAAASSARILVTLLVALCLCGFDRPDPNVEEIVIPTKDGVRLSAHLYRPDAPAAEGALLIHGEAGSKEMFAVLAEQMRDRGVAALVVDLRGHGESRFRSNFRGETLSAEAETSAYPKDLEAAIHRLRDELTPECAVLLGGYGEGATLAAEATRILQTEDFWPALCLIQPRPDIVKMAGIADPTVPAVVLFGREDLATRQVARGLYRTGEGPRDIWQLDGGRGISQTMLQRHDFCSDLSEWFIKVAEDHRDQRRRSEATSSIERP